MGNKKVHYKEKKGSRTACGLSLDDPAHLTRSKAVVTCLNCIRFDANLAYFRRNRLRLMQGQSIRLRGARVLRITNDYMLVCDVTTLDEQRVCDHLWIFREHTIQWPQSIKNWRQATIYLEGKVGEYVHNKLVKYNLKDVLISWAHE